MALMTQERKKELAPNVKKVLKKYNMKWTLSVRNHSTLIVTIKEWEIDFCKYYSWRHSIEEWNHKVNTYRIEDNRNGIAKEFLLELKNAMNVWNFDKSDSMTDYFHVGRYIDINIGKRDKKYQLKKKTVI